MAIKDKQERKIKILFEEIYYNEQFEPYKVLCIEHPIDTSNQMINLDEKRLLFGVDLSSDEDIEILCNDQRNRKGLNILWFYSNISFFFFYLKYY